MFAAGSDFPPVQRCEQRSRPAWSAAAAETAAAAGSAHWCSDRPERHRGASPAGRTPEGQGSRRTCTEDNKQVLTHGFVRSNALPFHSSSAAYSQSSSSVPPFVAGIHEAPLCTFSRTTVARKSEYKVTNG